MTDALDGGRARRAFRAAAEGFAAQVAAIAPHQWDGPGLGVWTVRELVGHTSRALLTVETYLAAPIDPAVSSLEDAAEYFRASAVALADADAVAERGRQAAAALGTDPGGAIAMIAERVLTLVDATPDDAPVTTPVGRLTLLGYLPARTFELTVHGLDLAAASGQDLPPGLAEPVAESLALAAELARDTPLARAALLALTGRAPLPPGASVV